MIKVSDKVKLCIDLYLEDYDTIGEKAKLAKEDFLATLERCKTEQEIINVLINPYTFYTNGPTTEPSSDDIDRVVKKERIIIDEVVGARWLSKDNKGNGVLTPYKLMILPLNVRRNQQIIMKEGKSAKTNDIRNASGQVTSDSRSGAFTDAEVNIAVGHSAWPLQKELMGFASSDLVAKRVAAKEIMDKGKISLKDLPDESKNKQTLIMLHHFYCSMGWDTDLIRAPKR